MPCVICSDERTVRSHIVPKAFALDVRADAPHAVAGHKSYLGTKPSQGGFFSDNMLCAEHEASTALIDKYAVEFVRSVAAAWRDKLSVETLQVPNPKPQVLRSFAMLTVWREVHNDPSGELSLGPYEEPVRQHLFKDCEPPEWPLVIQRTNFQIPGRGAMDFNLHPYRVRFADRSGWGFTVVGVGFFLITDNRGLPAAFDWGRADLQDPLPITVADPLPATEVGALKAIPANMASKVTDRRKS